MVKFSFGFSWTFNYKKTQCCWLLFYSCWTLNYGIYYYHFLAISDNIPCFILTQAWSFSEKELSSKTRWKIHWLKPFMDKGLTSQRDVKKEKRTTSQPFSNLFTQCTAHRGAKTIMWKILVFKPALSASRLLSCILIMIIEQEIHTRWY